MKKEDFIRKITSRKFIIACIAMIFGIITLLVGKNDTVETIGAAAMTIIPAVVYCIMEGKVDAASVKQITDAAAEASEKLGAKEEVTETIQQIGGAAGMLVSEDSDPEATSVKKNE